MSLIDYFNAFQRVSKIHKFSANTRSLYFAILGEFNSLRFPATAIVLENTYLQNLSGIRSTSSFDVARGVLINVGLIKYKKINASRQSYELVDTSAETEAEVNRKTSENEEKTNRKVDESRLGLLTVPNTTTEKEKEKEKDEDAPASAEFVSRNSAEVLEAWERWGGQRLFGGHALKLIEIENRYGKEVLVAAIEKAGQSDKLGGLSIKYLEGILEHRAARKYDGGKVEKVPEKFGGVDIAPPV